MPLYQKNDSSLLHWEVLPNVNPLVIRGIVLAVAMVPWLETSAVAQELFQEISPGRLGRKASLLAQTTLPPNTPLPTDQDLTPRNPELIPEPAPTPSEPVPDDLLPSIDAPPGQESPLSGSAETLCVNGFQVVDGTIFPEAELNEAIEAALSAEDTVPESGASADCRTGRRLTFDQILLARSTVTRLYLDNGYVTSGAIIPADTPFRNNIVTIQAVEGSLESIQVNGNRRLRDAYISSRLGIAGRAPLNQAELLEGLQLLQLNPLISSIRADLQAGTVPGTNILVVDVAEADSFDVTIDLNNNRSPSVGSFRRGITLREGNLLGLGDAVSLGYVNTAGSNEFSGSYSIPVSPYDTMLTASASISNNEVIEDPFQTLDISSDASNYSLSLEHPIIRTPSQELDLGLSLTRQFSQTELGLNDVGPFPLTTGADNEGRTITSAVRFSQAWTKRNTKQVLALRSQFNLGLGSFLDGTTNDDADLPDNSFLSWQGQAQWVRRLGDESLLLLRGSAQLAANGLLSAEQLGAGGQATVRGYRQEELLTDNGIQASVEARFPILRINQLEGTLQVTPFVDFGHGWNVNGIDPETDTLLGIGTGFLWQQPNITARLDWGIPLISASDGNDSLQESGIYLSLQYSFL